MKQLIKSALVLVTVTMALIGSVLILYAAGAHGGNGQERGRGRFGGEVTEVSSESVTVVGYGRFAGGNSLHPEHPISDTNPLHPGQPISDSHPIPPGQPISDTHPIPPGQPISDTHPIHPGQPISDSHPLPPGHPISDTNPMTQTPPLTDSVPFTRVALFTDTTAVRLVECQCDGTLADITVGDHIDVRGVRLSDDSFVALTITIAPDGDKLGGKVTALNGTTISVVGRGNVSGTIVTDATTKFLTRDGEATLADVAVGKKVAGYGVLQSDGSLLARVVLIQGGKSDSSTLSAAAADASEMTITVDSAAIDALVNNLASDNDQPLEESAMQKLFLPVVSR